MAGTDREPAGRQHSPRRRPEFRPRCDRLYPRRIPPGRGWAAPGRRAGPTFILARRRPHIAARGEHHGAADAPAAARSEEHTSELQSLMRISYAVFCLKKKNIPDTKYIKRHRTTNHEAQK